MRNQNQNVVQAGSGNGFNPLGMVLRSWQRKKEIDYRFGHENELMTRQHELAMERDKNRTMNDIMAAGTIGVFNSHFDMVKDTRQHGQKIDQIKQQGRQTRLTETHKGKRATKDLETQTKGLYANSQDPSTGISPLMSAPGRLQNIGPLLKGNPLLGVNPVTKAGENPAADAGTPAGGKKRGRKPKAAPIAPMTGTDAKPDQGPGWVQDPIPFDNTPAGPNSGSAEVTGAKIKKPRAPRVKKTGTEGGL